MGNSFKDFKINDTVQIGDFSPPLLGTIWGKMYPDNGVNRDEPHGLIKVAEDKRLKKYEHVTNSLVLVPLDELKKVNNAVKKTSNRKVARKGAKSS